MSSTALENVESSPVAEQTKLTSWQKLSDYEKAFVAAYVENGYSVVEAAGTLCISSAAARKMLTSSDVRRAVTEVQAELADLDFLNDKWVKAQLLRLFPKVMGEEPVPVVNQLGDEMEVRKFYPDIAMRVLEYVHPKTTAGKAAGNSTAVQINIDLGAMGIQRLEVAGNGQ